MTARPMVRAVHAAVVMPWRANYRVFVGQLLVMVVAGVAPVAAAWLLRAVIDALTAGTRSGPLLVLVVALAAAEGVQGILPSIGQYLNAQSGRATERLATSELFGAVIRLAGLRRLEDPAFLDRLNMAQRVVMAGPGQLVTSAAGIVQSALTLAGFLAALLVFSPVMALLVAAATVPAIFAEASVARRRAAMLEGISQAGRRQYFYANLISGHTAAKELRLFGLGTFFRNRMLNELWEIQQSGQRVDRREAVVYSTLAALSAVVAGAGLWWAVSAAARGRLTAGDVSLFVAALASVSAALSIIVSDAALAYQTVLTFRSYTDVVGGEPDLALPLNPAPVRPLRRGIEFQDVWFRYGPDKYWVLRGVSLFLPHDQAVALVGRNGAGKSTLVKLMCRFYDPDRGKILWDGVDLRELDLAGLRERISVVFQDYMTYELSARENIAVGDLAVAGDDELVRAAARQAGIDDVITALPKGYDTLLTTSYFDLADKEDPQTGVLLSGGQWQRVALARAFLRGGRDLVILDEPSSGLDAESEYEIHTALRNHHVGRTTLMISHRLNAIRDADNIVVLAEGVVAEEGDHDALIARDGLYARLFSLQARGFAGEAAEDDEVPEDTAMSGSPAPVDQR
jgi:ATP-binding cassette, subfamily B, bacterial